MRRVSAATRLGLSDAASRLALDLCGYAARCGISLVSRDTEFWVGASEASLTRNWVSFSLSLFSLAMKSRRGQLQYSQFQTSQPTPQPRQHTKAKDSQLHSPRHSRTCVRPAYGGFRIPFAWSSGHFGIHSGRDSEILTNNPKKDFLSLAGVPFEFPDLSRKGLQAGTGGTELERSIVVTYPLGTRIII